MARLRSAHCLPGRGLLGLGLLTLTVALTACGQKTVRDLDGWQGYTFGMTQAQVTAVNRIPWIAKSSTDWVSARPVHVGSLVYNAELKFSPSGKLSDIGLLSQQGGSTAAACEQTFRRVLSELARGYGPFEAVTPEGRQTTHQGMERDIATSWQKKELFVNEPEASIYDVQNIRERTTPSSPWRERTKFETVYRADARSLVITGAFQDDGPFKVCLALVRFHADD